MNRIFKSLFLVLFFFSALSIVFLKSDYNIDKVDLLNNKINLLDESEILVEGFHASGRNFTFSNEEHLASVTCHIEKGYDGDICGLVFVLPQEHGQGFPLDHYDSLNFNIESHSTNIDYNHRIRVFVKNILKPNSDETEVITDFKYHAVRIKSNGEMVVPLSRFKVETWWEDMNNIPFNLSYVDMSTVSSIEFFVNDMPVKGEGDYTITLSKLELVGRFVADAILYKVLLYTWLLFSVFSVVFYFLLKLEAFNKMRGQAYHDPDSNLLNMIGFEEKYKKVVNKKATFYRVRVINWNSLVRHFGLLMANYLLKQVVIKNAGLNKNYFSITARLNNNELIFVRNGGPLSVEQEEIFISAMLSPINVSGLGELRLDVKVGVSLEEKSPKDSQFVLDRTDISIQSILRNKTRLQFYSREVSQQAEQKTFLEKQIKLALKRRDFYLLYMPIYSASANKVIGVEALLRCRLQGLKDISPEVYISIAEETGLVRDIDLMVIDMALRDFSQFNFPHDFTLSINLSSKELLDTSFVSHFKRMVNRAEFDFNRLCLEITETFLLDIDTVCIKTIDDFRAMGCKVSLDDFGTGYTSFQQLVNFPVDEIKIDRDFIGGMKNNKGYDAIVNSLISIADAYNYKVVAEGVEDIETYELLVSKGCDFFQGYYFSKPVKLSDIYLMTEKNITDQSKADDDIQLL